MNYLKRADEALARASKSAATVVDTQRRCKAAERDPWRHALAGIENMPDIPGKVARINGEIRIASGFLLDDVLGLDDLAYIDVLRLGRVMRAGGWNGPKSQWMGEKAENGYAKAKGYAKPIGLNEEGLSFRPLGRRRLLAG